MTPYETIRTKTEDLCLGVTLNSVGERDFQAAPGLGVNLNGRNFFTGKSVVGASSRCLVDRAKRSKRHTMMASNCRFLAEAISSFSCGRESFAPDSPTSTYSRNTDIPRAVQ